MIIGNILVLAPLSVHMHSCMYYLCVYYLFHILIIYHRNVINITKYYALDVLPFNSEFISYNCTMLNKQSKRQICTKKTDLKDVALAAE